MDTALQTIDSRGIAVRPSFWHKWRTLLFNRAPLTVANFTDRLAATWGERSALLLDRPIESSYFNGNVISFNELHRLVQRAANALAAVGVKRGDRVVLATLNRVELAFAEFGALRLGAVPVPLNYMLTAAEMAKLVERCGARVMVVDRSVFANNIKTPNAIPSIDRWIMVTSGPELPEGFASFAELMVAASDTCPAVALGDDDPAIIFFTAGTTGTPRGAFHTNGSLMHSFRRYARLAALMPTPRTRLGLMVMPLAHTGGHQNLLINLALGTPSLLVGSFDPEKILDLMERYRVSTFSGIPTMYRMLLDAGAEKRDLRSVQLWGGGGDSFPRPLVERFREIGARRLGPFTFRPAFLTGYGLAETAGQLSMTPPFAVGDGCIGWFLPGISSRLIDERGADVRRGEVGELIVKTPGLMRGYWDDDAGTAAAIQDGWFRTGDLVRRGRFRMTYFVAREKEMIKVGGYSVYPAEVEEILIQHPDVERAVVVGLPHATKGELPVAGIVLRDGSLVDELELLAWAEQRVAAYRCPRRVVILDAIPQGSSMKPLRRAVRTQLIEAGITVESRSERARQQLAVSA